MHGIHISYKNTTCTINIHVCTSSFLITVPYRIFNTINSKSKSQLCLNTLHLEKPFKYVLKLNLFQTCNPFFLQFICVHSCTLFKNKYTYQKLQLQCTSHILCIFSVHLLRMLYITVYILATQRPFFFPFHLMDNFFSYSIINTYFRKENKHFNFLN